MEDARLDVEDGDGGKRTGCRGMEHEDAAGWTYLRCRTRVLGSPAAPTFVFTSAVRVLSIFCLVHLMFSATVLIFAGSMQVIATYDPSC